MPGQDFAQKVSIALLALGLSANDRTAFAEQLRAPLPVGTGIPAKELIMHDRIMAALSQVVEEPQRALVHKANSAQELYVLKQTHPVDGLEPRYKRLHTGKIQAAMFEELARLGITDIFDEGHVETLIPTSPGRAKELREPEVKSAFSSLTPGLWTERQLELFEELGAARIYAALNPKVTIHATNDLNNELEISDKIKTLAPCDPAGEELTFAYREKRACQLLAKFYSTADDKARAVLIFGAEHQIDQIDFTAAGLSSNEVPSITHVSFPKLDALNPYKISDAIAAAPLEEQGKLIHQAWVIETYAFAAIQSLPGQIAALDKLRADSREFFDKDDLRYYLINRSKFSRVHDLIDKHYLASTGPFDDFHALSQRTVAALDSSHMATMISNSRDPVRQARLIDQASKMSLFCFYNLQSSELQLKALPKLEPDYCSDEPVEVQYEDLRKQAKNEEVRKYLELMYLKKEGLFKPLVISKALLQK